MHKEGCTELFPSWIAYKLRLDLLYDEGFYPVHEEKTWCSVINHAVGRGCAFCHIKGRVAACPEGVMIE